MKENQSKRKRLSPCMLLHSFKLTYRSALFLTVLGIYLYNRLRKTGHLFDKFLEHPVILSIVWIIFVLEMIFRLIPSNTESMGCQKKFARNYRPRGAPSNLPKHMPSHSEKKTRAVAGAWLLLNGGIAALYGVGIIDFGILLLICLAYSVCDMICILFFCPFQTWFLKNKCCTACRIYNWDYAMMFTPLICIPSLYTWSLLGLALVLLFDWEWQHLRHPERFYEDTNESLACQHCTEKLCHHKRQLRRFQKKLFAELKILEGVHHHEPQ